MDLPSSSSCSSEREQHVRSTTSCSSLGKTRFDWTIRDFMTVFASMGDEERLYSATFDTSADTDNTNSTGFRLYGYKTKDGKGFGLYLEIMDKIKEVWADFTLAVLKADGGFWGEPLGPNTKKFEANASSWGWSEAFSMQKLQTARREVLPNGHITVTCNLAVRFGNSIKHSPVENVVMPTFPRSNSSSNSLLSMLSSGYLTDVTLVCGDNTKSIPCHRVILASRSDVFKAMFGDFAEGRNMEVGIKDVEPDIMDTFVKAFYSDSVCDTIADDESCLQLLKAADMYNFEYLKVACEERMAKGLSVENAASVLSWAMACNASNLKGVALKFVKEHVMEIIETSGFVELMTAFPDALKKVRE